MNDNNLKHIIIDDKHLYVVDLPCVGEIITSTDKAVRPRLIIRREWRMRIGVAMADPVYFSREIPNMDNI